VNGIELFRTKKVYTHICRLNENTWQGWQSLKIIFEELEKVYIQEIRELLDEDTVSDAN